MYSQYLILLYCITILITGRFHIHTLFRIIPTEVIDKLIFSKAKITPEDVINILDPVYTDMIDVNGKQEPIDPTLKKGQIDFIEFNNIFSKQF